MYRVASWQEEAGAQGINFPYLLTAFPDVCHAVPAQSYRIPNQRQTDHNRLVGIKTLEYPACQVPKHQV